ncbi:MAG TPA: hypothetical protein VFB62_06835, partial [Polyangiaceae bacterium]|nr:hypothetical protein [Polyangiaceae bacterium]
MSQPAHKDDRLPSIRFPESPVGTESFQVDIDTVFNWDYRVQIEELRRLYEKGKDAQWNAKSYLKWDTDVDPEAENQPNELMPIYGTPLWDRLDKTRELPKLRRLMTAWVLSNFLHGEQGALIAASQIVSAVPDTDAKFYAATQVMD